MKHPSIYLHYSEAQPALHSARGFGFCFSSNIYCIYYRRSVLQPRTARALPGWGVQAERGWGVEDEWRVQASGGWGPRQSFHFLAIIYF